MRRRTRIQHAEVPQEELREVEESFRRKLVAFLRCPDERIKSCTSFDPGMEGRTGVTIDADPPLTEAEWARVKIWIRVIAVVFGGRPPMFEDGGGNN